MQTPPPKKKEQEKKNLTNKQTSIVYVCGNHLANGVLSNRTGVYD